MNLQKAGTSVLAFDLDGTLVDSIPDLAYSLGYALEAHGFRAPSEDETRAWVGDGVEELVRRALAHAVPLDIGGGSTPNASPEAERDLHSPSTAAASDPHAGTVDEAHEHLVTPVLEAFSRCYAENLFVRSRLYPGVVEALDTLRKRGFRLCCVTNKRLAYANDLLEQAGILDRFELVIGGDSLPEKKPSPMPLLAATERLGVAPAEMAFVGDSPQDMLAARAAGCVFVWASYGYQHIAPQERDAALTIGAVPELVEAL